MTVVVDTNWYPNSVGYDDVLSSNVVRGSTWQSYADAINAINARGGQLILSNKINTAFAAGSSNTLRYYTWPRALHYRRVWIVDAMVSSGAARFTVQDGANPSVTQRVGRLRGGSFLNEVVSNFAPPIIYPADCTATATPGEATLDVDVASGGGDVYLTIGCFDMPRARLEVDGSENAAAEAGPGFAIYTAADRGFRGIMAAEAAAVGSNRRALAHAWDPTGFSTTSTTFQNVFPDSGGIRCRGRKYNGTSTTVEIAWAAYVTATTQDAQVRVTAASGATDTQTATAGAGAGWITGLVTIDREDLADDTDGGGVSGRRYGDGLTVELRTVSGGGTALIQGFAASEQ